MNKIFLLLRSNLKEIMRNKAALFWTFMFPIIFIGIFGLVYGNEDISALKVGFVVNDEGQTVDTLVDTFRELDLFELTEGDEVTLGEDLKNGDLSAVIIIPSDFSAGLLDSSAQITVKYDESQQTTSGIVLSAVQGIIDGWNQAITRSKPPITIKQESIQAKGVRMIDWLVPGILGMSIMQGGLYSSAAFVTLREKKVYRRLAVTPLKRAHIVISQVLFRLILGFCQSVVLLLFGYLLYRVPVQGNLFLLTLVIAESTVMFLSMGYIVASVAKNEESFEPIVQIIAMPMMFLSGVFFPVEFMPEFVRPAVNALPLTYLNDSLRAVINNAQGLAVIGNDLIVMGVWLVVSMVVAIKIFRWE